MCLVCFGYLDELIIEFNKKYKKRGVFSRFFVILLFGPVLDAPPLLDSLLFYIFGINCLLRWILNWQAVREDVYGPEGGIFWIIYII